MKFEIERENLLEGLNAVKGAVGTARTFWSTSNVLLKAEDDRVVFTANNMSDVAEAAMAAKVHQAGAICVAFAPLNEWVKLASDGVIVVEIPEENAVNLRLTAGRSVAHFVTMPAADFPPTPVFPTETTLTMLAEEFQRWVTQGGYAGAKDDTRPTMKAALLKVVPLPGESERWGAKMYTTDGFRLAYAELPLGVSTGEALEWLIPTNFLQMIVGQAGKWVSQVKLTVVEGMVFADMGGVRFATHLTEGRYPEVEAVIPSVTRGTAVAVHAADLASAIQAATVFSEESTKCILSLECGGDGEETKVQLQTESAAIGGGKNILEAQLVRGSSMDIVVNGKYLLQAVKAAKAELVVLQVSAPYEPLLIYPFAAEGASPECKAVIMPMHLK